MTQFAKQSMLKLSLALAAITTAVGPAMAAKAAPKEPTEKQVATLSCLAGVYRAGDFDEKNPKAYQGEIVRIPLFDSGNGNVEGDEQVKLNGEDVTILIWQKGASRSLLQLTMTLNSSRGSAPRPPRGVPWYAQIGEFLFQDDESARTDITPVNPKAKVEAYGYLTNEGGTLAIPSEMVQVLKQEGKWGTYPLDRSALGFNQQIAYVDFIREQLAAGKIDKDKVVGLGTAFNCAYEY